MPVLGSSPAVASAQGAFGLGYAVPEGWGAHWRAARDGAATTRTEVPIFGDSTTFGSGALYSWVQRLRDRSVAAGYADGGKGIFPSGEEQILYDAPEVNGIVSNAWSWAQDGAYSDVLGGGGYGSNTAGEALTVQGRITAAAGEFRVWYVNRAAGSFTVSIDGGAPVTVTTTAVNPITPAFYSVADLSPGIHTATITNGASSVQVVGPCFMNTTGVVYQKYARSGQVMYLYFDPLGRNAALPTRRDQYSQALLGLAVGGGGSDGAWRQQLSTVPRAPRSGLAILHLGYNDFTNMPKEWDSLVTYVTNQRVWYSGNLYRAVTGSTNITPPGNTANWAAVDGASSGANDIDSYTEAIHLFCRMAQSAGADPLVISGEFILNAASAYRLGGRMAQTVRSTALACGAAWADFALPVLGRPNGITGLAANNNPHLNKPGYVAQADFLWDKVLSL